MDYMSVALEEANLAYQENEVPVGCVIVYKDKIIARTHNMKEKKQCVTAHAELLAIEEACRYFHNWHLNECDMYITLEPCIMCTGAIIQSRFRHIYIGTAESRWPGLKKITDTFTYNHYISMTFLNDQRCKDILSLYFKEKRNNV